MADQTTAMHDGGELAILLVVVKTARALETRLFDVWHLEKPELR